MYVCITGLMLVGESRVEDQGWEAGQLVINIP